MGGERQTPMPILHKSSNSKVKKTVSSGGYHKLDHQRYDIWQYPDSLVPWNTEDTPPFLGDMGYQPSLYPASSFQFDQWNEPQPPWTPGFYPMVPVENFFSESDYPLDHQPSTEDAFTMEHAFNLKDESHTNAPSSLPSQPPSLIDSGSFPVLDSNWDNPWDKVPMANETHNNRTRISVDAKSYSVRKRILKLNLEMINDLEALESDSDIMQSLNILGDDISSLGGRLEVPIFRMLNHSTKFLDIIESGLGRSEDPSHDQTPSVESAPFEDAKNFPKSREQSTAFVASPQDHTDRTVSSPQSDRSRGPSLPAYDLVTSMGMLTAYSHLNCIYCAIFNRLYQLFLLVPPAEASSFLLLPNSHYGQFNMDRNITLQIHVLTDLCTNMLAKMELALGMSCGEVDGDINPVTSDLGIGGPLASVRDQIMTEERNECSIPLKETMACLRKLVNDPSFV
ncbi:hypothetical protein N7466_007152 [Penicillium verhagenii]|uniref:uncharacterized protein n=1 Tax=Penicillium verhagenii TaxID=1562060 RepID=UPI002544F765|nr:uncharacterized protein N7466_007152 [Penicillium verhagenii]KAJ5928196.1 hypothetical protein N7466_007152 [Penicillium verhagenii]